MHLYSFIHSFNSCSRSFYHAPSIIESVEVRAVNKAHANHGLHGTPSRDFPVWGEPAVGWSSLKPVCKGKLCNTPEFASLLLNTAILAMGRSGGT